MHSRQAEARDRKKKKERTKKSEIIAEAGQSKQESAVQRVPPCSTRDQPEVSHMSSSTV